MTKIHGNSPRPQYTEAEKAEKRKEIAEQMREEAIKRGEKPPRTISFAPELEPGFHGVKGKNKLERTPESDKVMLSSAQPMMLASIKPSDIPKGIALATSIMLGLKELVDAGINVWDTISDRFDFKSKEQEEAVKEFLTPEAEKAEEVKEAA